MTMIPVLIDGVSSERDEADLVKTDGVFEDDNERTTFVEYRLHGSDVIVHRSVHVTLKKWPEGFSGIAQPLGG